MFLSLKIGLSNSDFVQNDQRSARYIMVIARMPEDRSKTVKNLKTNFKNLHSHIHLCVYTCGAH
eukprot:1059968-Heterocapsa_arctica.AAC.1